MHVRTHRSHSTWGCTSAVAAMMLHRYRCLALSPSPLRVGRRGADAWAFCHLALTPCGIMLCRCADLLPYAVRMCAMWHNTVRMCGPVAHRTFATCPAHCSNCTIKVPLGCTITSGTVEVCHCTQAVVATGLLYVLMMAVVATGLLTCACHARRRVPCQFPTAHPYRCVHCVHLYQHTMLTTTMPCAALYALCALYGCAPSVALLDTWQQRCSAQVYHGHQAGGGVWQFRRGRKLQQPGAAWGDQTHGGHTAFSRVSYGTRRLVVSLQPHTHTHTHIQHREREGEGVRERERARERARERRARAHTHIHTHREKEREIHTHTHAT